MLDLADIQGNINRPYGRYGFPFSRHLFFHIFKPEAGRRFVDAVRARVTTAEPWTTTEADPGVHVTIKPKITLNIGFSWWGLDALGLPTDSLRVMPAEFIDGMAKRRIILGDIGPSDPMHWDDAWRRARPLGPDKIHVWVGLNAQMQPDGTPVSELNEWTNWLQGLANSSTAGDGSRPEIVMIGGHGRDNAPWQDSAARFRTLPDGRVIPTPFEHFGFTDGISDPVFAGQISGRANSAAAIGGGKIVAGKYDVRTSWKPLATGEFLLGHADEGQEPPVAAAPAVFVRNGTFMAFRKLHQNIASFNRAIADHARVYQRVTGIDSLEEATETLRAKMIGRWSNGVPMTAAPTWAAMQTLLARFPGIQEVLLRKPRDAGERKMLAEYERMLTAIRYADDPEGLRCPVAAHVRRANPRDMLDPEGTPDEANTDLTNRRRLIRRGLPYGEYVEDDTSEHGVAIMMLCTSLVRQFEFVQQQWMQYGLDFNSGNDTCPIIGNRDQSAKFVIPADPASTQMPYIAANLPLFVETRGGEYFFIPSVSALRMMAMGTVDPT